MSAPFTITKSMIQDYCKQGFTVKQMANAITQASGITCSEGLVRRFSKEYGIDLRRKNKPTLFRFEAPVSATQEEREETRTMQL